MRKRGGNHCGSRWRAALVVLFAAAWLVPAAAIGQYLPGTGMMEFPPEPYPPYGWDWPPYFGPDLPPEGPYMLPFEEAALPPDIDPDYDAAMRALDNDPEALVQAAQALVVKYPDDPEAHALLATGFAQTGLHQDAVAEWLQCINLGTGDPVGAWQNMGLSMLELGQADGAVNAFHAAANADPENKWVWLALSDLCADLGRYQDMVPALQRAVAIDPDDATAWRALGSAHTQLGEFGPAIDALNLSLEIDPRNSDTWILLSTLHTLAGNMQGAIAAREQATDLNPTADNLESLVVMYLDAGFNEDALLALLRLELVDPDRARELQQSL